MSMFQPLIDVLRQETRNSDINWGKTRLIFNASAHSIRTDHAKTLSQPFLAASEALFVRTREMAPDLAWPVRIDFDWTKDNYPGVRLGRVQLCMARVALTDRAKLWTTESTWRESEKWQEGIECAFSALRAIASALPATNRPIQAWSQAKNLMGVDHVSSEGMHARTEIEYLLKTELFSEGPDHLQKILDSGRIPRGQNDDRVRLVSEDLQGLEFEPEGRRESLVDVMEAFAGMVAARRPEGQDGP